MTPPPVYTVHVLTVTKVDAQLAELTFDVAVNAFFIDPSAFTIGGLPGTLAIQIDTFVIQILNDNADWPFIGPQTAAWSTGLYPDCAPGTATV